MRTISTVRSSVVIGAIVMAWPAAGGRAQTPAPEKHAIIGAWTLNKDLSDQAPSQGDQGGDRTGGSGRGMGGGGRRGGGGFGGGFGGGRRGMGRGGGGGGTTMSPEEMARAREAMRDLTTPPDHLTIVESDSTIVITSADGRTTRLSTDGKKIKDDNTGVERKTKWDGAKLVTEISGLRGSGKATQTLVADEESHQLRITVQFDSSSNGRGGQTPARTITHVYNDDKFTK